MYQTMRRGEVSQDLHAVAEILAKKNLLVDNVMNLSKTFPIVKMPLPLNQYVEQILEARNYTFLLFDGSAIQVGYQFDNQDRIISHKLAFFFSPLSLPGLRTTLSKIKEILGSKEDLIEILTRFIPEYLNDLKGHEAAISKHYEEAWQELTWVYGVRLDYDSSKPNSAKHPQSHATFFDDDCRIAVSDYFDLRRFFLLSFAHLWPFHDEVVQEIQQKIPHRSGTQNLIPGNYPSDYGVFFRFEPPPHIPHPLHSSR